MTDWIDDAVFYHIYPLGHCGAPERNDGASSPVPRLHAITERPDAIRGFGAMALYLGPVFESVAHGYDMVDYRGLSLYNFADNHDVDRAASLLPRPELLYPLYCLLFTMPGIPSIHYGSELGTPGRRHAHSDAALRPSIAGLEAAPAPQPGLAQAIRRLAGVRRPVAALRRGGYRELQVSARQFVFSRKGPDGRAVVALNADSRPAELDIPLPFPARRLRDELEAEERPGGEVFEAANGKLRLTLHPGWGRVPIPVE
jgi:glycosidase